MARHTQSDVEIPKAFIPLIRKSARYKGYYSGRGCAKTYSMAMATVMKAANDGWKWLCCREHQNSIKDSSKALIDYMIQTHGMSHLFHSTQNEITCRESAGGFIFEGLANNVQSIRSKAFVNGVWVDEANTVKQASLNVLIPTIREPKSELWFSWNPRFAKDPVDKLFRGEGNEMTDFDRELASRSGYDEWMISQRVTMDDNKFFPDVLRAEMERDMRRDVDRYRHIWMGEYASQSDAMVFRNWKIGEVELPPNAKPYYGADWGFSVDPSILVRCFVLQEKRQIYIDAEVGGVGVDVAKTPALFDSICDMEDPLHPRRWPIIADSSRPEVISHMQKNGYPKIVGARKGAGSVEEGVLFLQSYDITVHPRCKRVIDEMTLYCFETDPLTNDVLPTLADKDNHTIDGLRYAVEGIRRALIVKTRPVIVFTPRTYFGDNLNA